MKRGGGRQLGGAWMPGHCRCRWVWRPEERCSIFSASQSSSSPLSLSSGQLQRDRAPSFFQVFFRPPLCLVGSVGNTNMQIRRSVGTSRRELLVGSILCCNTCGLRLSSVNEDVVPGGWKNLEVTDCLVAMGTRQFEPSDLLGGWVQGVTHF